MPKTMRWHNSIEQARPELLRLFGSNLMTKYQNGPNGDFNIRVGLVYQNGSRFAVYAKADTWGEATHIASLRVTSNISPLYTEEIS
jgi:hypothetical protein